MSTNLSNHFRQQRIVLGLRPGQVARLLGYRSVVGAANKIIRFEQTGDVDSRFFRQLAVVLGVERATILRLMEKDRRELVQRWTQWARQPIKPHIIAEIVPGHYMKHDFPENVVTANQMETHASELASDLHQRIWLIFSRKVSVYFDAGGHKRAVQEAAPGEPAEPFRLLSQRKVRSFFDPDGNDIDVRSLRWPAKRGPRVGR